MSWRDRWSNYERPKRPTRQRMTVELRDRLLEGLRRAVSRSPVLTELGIDVLAAGGFFHFQRRPFGGEPPVVIARALLLAETDLRLLLEAESSRGTYYKVAEGQPATVVRALAEDAAGTFHGLGAIERRAKKTKAGLQRERLKKTQEGFAYAVDGAKATVQEVLFHHFGLPLEVVAQPRDWYAYHRRPALRQHTSNRILVSFEATSLHSDSFGGTCLYARRGGRWGAYKIRPNRSESITEAETWLAKRDWVGW